MTYTLLLPSDHALLRINAMEINRNTGCELCYSREAHKLKNGALLCDHCRDMMRQMKECGE